MESDEDVKYKLRKITPVTSKRDPICSNSVYLSQQKPTTFGRIISDEVQIRLLSKVTPLMISRKHATISVKDGVITISDHDSINGVYVDNKRIRSDVPQELELGTRIAFGCGVGSNHPEFEYILEAVCNSRNKRSDPCRSQTEIVGSPSKRSKVLDSPVITIIESNAAQIKEQEEKIKKLASDLEAKEVLQNELMHKLEEKEKGLVEELEKQKQELETEREEAESKLKALLEQQLLKKEDLLRTEFDEQIQFLQQEKDLCENNLQAELSKKLSQTDEAYQQILEQQKIMLEQAMRSKESEKSMLIAELQVKEGLIEKYKSVEENQRQLEDCLDELRKEIKEKEQQLQEQQEVTKKVEINAKQTVIQTMEDEFTCIVCQELFIESTTLPCAHTFCELCLRLWMRKKKNCPVCRRRIKDKAVRSFVLDSAVEKMIESMDEDTKNRRKALICERVEQKRRDDAAEDPEGVKNMIHRPEDDTGNDEFDQRNETRNRREGYRRRSRSPRYRARARPYHYPGNHNNNYNNIHVGYHHQQQQQQQNVAPVIHQINNNTNSRYYQERGELVPSNYQTTHYNYNHNNGVVRCFNCGGIDHVARFCPRR